MINIQDKIESIWQNIFGMKMGDNTRRFFKNLSFSFLGGLGAFALLFIVNILAARFLGPEEYGKYSFFASIATTFATFLILEVDSGMAYFLSKTEKAESKKIISSFLFLYLLICAVFGGILFLFKNGVIDILDNFIEADLYSVIFILSLAVVFSLKRILEGVLRGKKFFLKQSIFKILETSLVFTTFLFIYKFFGIASYIDYFWAVFMGALAAIFGMIFYLRKEISLKYFNIENIKNVYNYSKLGFINSISALVLKSFDKFLVAVFFDIRTVGIYAVYYTVSILPASKISQLFINVYFPSISSGVDIKNLYKKIKKILLISFFPLFLGSIFSIYALILAFGQAYPMEHLWIFLLGIYAVINMFASVVSWAVAGFSNQGFHDYNKGVFWGLVVFLVLIGGAIIADEFSISWLIISFTINRAVMGIYSFIRFRNLAGF